VRACQHMLEQAAQPAVVSQLCLSAKRQLCCAGVCMPVCLIEVTPVCAISKYSQTPGTTGGRLCVDA